MNKKLVYLASAYSHDDPQVRMDRFLLVCKSAGNLIRKGVLVFSPICHSHPIVCSSGGPLLSDWETWKEFDMLMLARCQELLVLATDGWRESVGVQAEIAEAKRLGIPVQYIDESGEEVTVW